jgi:hypothetical protein
MTANEKRTETAYLKAYNRAMTAIKDLEAAIHDLPAPGGEIQINWAHVGSMSHYAQEIEELANGQ